MSRLVSAARSYTGVPFRHRGRRPGALDCAGLVWIAYKDCGLELPDFRLYGPEPHEDGLVTHVTAALGAPVALKPKSFDLLRCGDVVLICFEQDPHHLALIADYPLGGFSLLHADGFTGRVIEQRLSSEQLQKITHVFRRPA